MRSFRTEIRVEGDGLRLNPRRRVTGVGSCFADNITARMRQCMWEAENPCGVLYNPASIAKALRLLLLHDDAQSDYKFNQSIYQASEDVWVSWLFDSKIASSSREELTTNFREMRRKMKQGILQGNCLLVTFGTAFVYELQGEIVGNCHKQPAKMFERRMLRIEEIVNEWMLLIEDLHKVYPDLEIIFTVSPVRHLKDGAHGNTLSKSTLHISIDYLCQSSTGIHYFPAYELLLDDLRDYRFYSSDMAHPSEEAIEYIWEQFKSAYVDSDGLQRIREGENLYRRLHHRHLLNWTKEAAIFNEQTELLLSKFLSNHDPTL